MSGAETFLTLEEATVAMKCGVKAFKIMRGLWAAAVAMTAIPVVLATKKRRKYRKANEAELAKMTE